MKTYSAWASQSLSRTLGLHVCLEEHFPNLIKTLHFGKAKELLSVWNEAPLIITNIRAVPTVKTATTNVVDFGVVLRTVQRMQFPNFELHIELEAPTVKDMSCADAYCRID